MPPVPSGTFVHKREVFQGTLGPVAERTLCGGADEFMSQFGEKPLDQARRLYRALDNLTEAISEELGERGPPFCYSEAQKVLCDLSRLRDVGHKYPWKSGVWTSERLKQVSGEPGMNRCGP